MLAITTDPIDVAAVSDAVAHQGAGAICTFVGTVRDRHEGKDVASIDYDVHGEMALAVLERIAAEVTERWADARTACVHRVGYVALGEASVAIACSATHRAEAFAACRHVIERIKQDLPVWKKEFHPDGSFTWSACHHSDDESGG